MNKEEIIKILKENLKIAWHHEGRWDEHTFIALKLGDEIISKIPFSEE
jgi:hypothetical protein